MGIPPPPVQTPNFSWAEPKLFRKSWIDSDANINTSWTKFKRRKMLISVVWVELLTNYVIVIYALAFRYMKSSASESKPFQSRSKGEIPGRARRKERPEPFQIETGVPINWFRRWTFLSYRFGSWKVRSLNQASLVCVPLVSIILEARNDRNIILGLWCYLSGTTCHLLGQNTQCNRSKACPHPITPVTPYCITANGFPYLKHTGRGEIVH